MTNQHQRDGIEVRLLTAAGEVFKPGDTVTITYAGGAFAVNGSGVDTIEESGTVVTLFAITPEDFPQTRDVITYQISPEDWQRALRLRSDHDDDHPQRFRVDSV